MMDEYERFMCKACDEHSNGKCCMDCGILICDECIESFQKRERTNDSRECKEIDNHLNIDG